MIDVSWLTENGVKLFNKGGSKESYLLVLQNNARHNIAPHLLRKKLCQPDTIMVNYFEPSWSSETLNRLINI